MDRLRAMQAFVLVVDSGSFSAAARRLNVGQPALKTTQRSGAAHARDWFSNLSLEFLNFRVLCHLGAYGMTEKIAV